MVTLVGALMICQTSINIMAFSQHNAAATLSMTKFRMTKFSITKFSLTTLSITTLSRTFKYCDTQHNNTPRNDTKYIELNVIYKLSVANKPMTLNALMLNVVMLNVVMLSWRQNIQAVQGPLFWGRTKVWGAPLVNHNLSTTYLWGLSILFSSFWTLSFRRQS